MIRKFNDYVRTVICYNCESENETKTKSKKTSSVRCPDCGSMNVTVKVAPYIRKKDCSRCKGGKLKNVYNEKLNGIWLETTYGTCECCKGTGQVDVFDEEDKSLIEFICDGLLEGF